MMSAPAVGTGAPERIAAIQERIQSFRGARAGSVTTVDFDRLLAAEQTRQALGSQATTTAGAGGGTVSTSLLPGLAPPAGPTTSDPAAGVPTGEAVIDAATEHLGVPYLWGGTDPEKGFDCSGLVQAAYRKAGVEMPKWSRHQATMGVEIGSIDDALPGDVLAFGHPVNHVALYVGDGKMLHAPRTGDVVKISEIDRPIATIRRIVAPGATIPAGTTVDAEANALVGPPTPAPVPTANPEIPVTGTADRSPAELAFTELFRTAGAAWDIDPDLLAAVAQVESGFDRGAVSPAGAQGLMQFMPATARSMGVDPWDPASAIDGAARYLRTSLDRFGSTDLALASYNAGPGAVARHGGIPPYRETQNYVRKVLAAWKERS